MEIRYDPAPGMIGPLVQTDLDPSMPDEMSVQPQPVFAPPKFQFEGLPRKYRAKAVYEIARQRQESADMDADTVIQGTYLEDLRKELSQTRAGREALRRQMEAKAPRMPDAVPQTSLGESLAALLTGLGTGRWNDAAGTAMGSAQAREQRRYAQESQDWQQGQRLAEMDYGAAAEEEDALRRLIQQYQTLQEKARIDRSQAETEQRYRLEQIAAQNEGRVQLADLKTPEGVYRQLAPLVGHDEALKLATASMSLSAAKAEDVPLNRETQNRRVDESVRTNKAREMISQKNLDLRKLSIGLTHQDREAALNARIAMFHEGQDNMFARQYKGHMYSLSRLAAGQKLKDAEYGSMSKMRGKLETDLAKAEREYDVSQRTLSALKGLPSSPESAKALEKAAMDALEAEAKRDAIQSEIDATDAALTGWDVKADYSNILAPKIGAKPRASAPAPLAGNGYAPMPVAVPQGTPTVKPETPASKTNPMVLGGIDLMKLLGTKPPAKSKPKAGTVKSNSGNVRWRFK